MDKQTTGIVFLILNLVLPGLGTVIWGNRTHGIIQLIMWILGVPLSILLIGAPIALAAWIWALISSLKFLGVMK